MSWLSALSDLLRRGAEPPVADDDPARDSTVEEVGPSGLNLGFDGRPIHTPHDFGYGGPADLGGGAIGGC